MARYYPIYDALKCGVSLSNALILLNAKVKLKTTDSLFKQITFVMFGFNDSSLELVLRYRLFFCLQKELSRHSLTVL